VSLLTHTGVTETTSWACLVKASQGRFYISAIRAWWQICDVSLQGFIRHQTRDSVSRSGCCRIFGLTHSHAAQSLSTWERNLGVQTHQVVTGTNYHSEPQHSPCLPWVLRCLAASPRVAASPRQAEGQPQPRSGITSTSHRG